MRERQKGGKKHPRGAKLTKAAIELEGGEKEDQGTGDHFSVTIHTHDLAVLRCLPALAAFNRKEGNIPKGNTKGKVQSRHGHFVTLRFSDAQYRDSFLAEARRLLPRALWHKIATGDNDPARSGLVSRGHRARQQRRTPC